MNKAFEKHVPLVRTAEISERLFNVKITTTTAAAATTISRACRKRLKLEDSGTIFT